ncbi:MFS transporter [Herbaspirillum sp. RV1423]|uniref:MFS transporter n=1 Tax=Herbaspirillum sp. RV1423 TaxID=1443993 RepID=UPI0004BAD46F|nr:MFS transporter [Herbaspirillum sp. RV1423]
MSSIETNTVRKVCLRIVPLLFVLWLINFLDRVNISFAALQMNEALHFTPAVFGFGAGIFFLGYILFEIPSNLMLYKFGARRWLTRIIVSWGIVSMAQAWIVGEHSLYSLRFLLGVAEAGYLPGMLYYLTLWVPAENRAKVIAQIMSANTVAVIIGAPLSGLIMQMDSALGVAGWQWVFVIEGGMAVVLGIFTFFYLTDKPAQASWLSNEERTWLVAKLSSDSAVAGHAGISDVRVAFKAPIVWMLGVLYFFVGLGFFGLTIWLPQIVKQISGFSILAVSMISAIPFVVGAVAMIANGKHSDRTGERRWHLSLSLLLGAAGLTASAMSSSPLVSFIAVCFSMAGISGALGVFWSVPSTFLTGQAAAGGLALINTISGLSGFLGPYVIGFIRGLSPNFSYSLYGMAASLLIATVLAATLPFNGARQRHPGLQPMNAKP